jgi:hypothetical protein
MYCPKCQSLNEENVQFCRICGSNLHYQQVENQSNDVSSTLLVVFIAIAFVCQIAQFAIQSLVPNWYSSPIKHVLGCLWIVNSISWILPALAIKNKVLKIVGIILVSLLVIYHLYSSIEFMMRGY